MRMLRSLSIGGLVLLCIYAQAPYASSISSTTTVPGLRDAVRDTSSAVSLSTFVGGSFDATKLLSSSGRSTTSREIDISASLLWLGYKRNAVSVRIVRFSTDALRRLVDKKEQPADGVEILGESGRVSSVLTISDVPEWAVTIRTGHGKVDLSYIPESDTIVGDAILAGKAYEIRPVPLALAGGNAQDGSRPHLLIELPQLDSELDDQDVLGFTDSADQRWTGRRALPSESQAEGIGVCATGNEEKVLKPLTIHAGYTALADRRAMANTATGGRGSGIRALTHSGLLAFRDALRNAGLSVEIGETISASSYEEPKAGSASEMLQSIMQDLKERSPNLDDFFSKRKLESADLAVLIVDLPTDRLCGMAGAVGADAQHALAVVNWSCITRMQTIAHEFGHLLGAHHDDDKTAAPRFARAFVYANPGSRSPFVSIMGHRSSCRAEVACSRVMDYSNPFLPATLWTEDSGVKMGVLGSSDNACILRQTVPIAVDFGESL